MVVDAPFITEDRVEDLIYIIMRKWEKKLMVLKLLKNNVIV